MESDLDIGELPLLSETEYQAFKEELNKPLDNVSDEEFVAGIEHGTEYLLTLRRTKGKLAVRKLLLALARVALAPNAAEDAVREVELEIEQLYASMH